ncbi:hypothetical protein DSECCO2_577200 [anaerobic digester metagenome]
MAREGISYGQVVSAIEELVGSGKQATINGIRQVLGTGSPNTIHKHMVEWRNLQQNTTVACTALPEAVTTVIARELDRVAAQARAEIEDQLSQAKIEALELATAGEALEVEIQTLKASIAAITTDRDAVSAIAAERQKEIIHLSEAVKREQKDAESVRVDLGKMQLKVDLSIKENTQLSAEVAILRKNYEKTRQEYVESERNRAVFQAHLESAMLSIDNEKQRREILELDKAKMVDELDNLRKALDNEKKERAELETKKAVLEAKLDAANKVLEKEKEICEELRLKKRAKTERGSKAKQTSNKKVE